MSAVAVAAALDVVAGQPPAAVHPVVWMGRFLATVGRRLPSDPPLPAAAAGAAAWAVGVAASVVAGDRVQRWARRLPRPAGTALTGVALWTLCSGRQLYDEVAAVEKTLDRDGLNSARHRLSRIVSRDTTTLDEAEVRASALESLAENLSDSVVAPLFWYAVGGLPAATAYRFANTADAMWGYRTPRWRAAGGPAARADDMLNLAPARLTAPLLLPSILTSGSTLRTVRREARRTPSPNGGWPMGALAVALDLRLAKPGHYVLNPAGRPPAPTDTAAALRLATRAAAAAVVLATVAERLRPRLRRDTT